MIATLLLCIGNCVQSAGAFRQQGTAVAMTRKYHRDTNNQGTTFYKTALMQDLPQHLRHYHLDHASPGPHPRCLNRYPARCHHRLQTMHGGARARCPSAG
jgi:hypothetical protein